MPNSKESGLTRLTSLPSQESRPIVRAKFRVFRRFPFALALITITAVTLLSACGPAAYVPPPITVTFTPGFLPPTEMTVSEQCGVAATVTNDPKNQGLNWTATCGSANCGFYSGGGGGSAIPITYNSPPVVPSGGTVTLTATSVTDPTKSVSSSPITIGSTSSGCIAP